MTILTLETHEKYLIDQNKHLALPKYILKYFIHENIAVEAYSRLKLIGKGDPRPEILFAFLASVLHLLKVGFFFHQLALQFRLFFDVRFYNLQDKK